MTNEEIDYLRALQDRWLAVPSVASHVRDYGLDERIIPGTEMPTFRDVKQFVLPKWKHWFEDFFDGR